MTQKRSRRYPNYNLKDALEFTELVYEIGGLGNAPIDSVLSAKGNKSKRTKSFAYLVSSAQYFGLIEVYENSYRITDLAKIILLPRSENDESVQKALVQAAINPKLYKEVIDQYLSSKLPKKEFLMNNFIQKGIISSVAEKAVDSFIESLEYAGILDEDGSLSLETTERDNLADDQEVDYLHDNRESPMKYQKFLAKSSEEIQGKNNCGNDPKDDEVYDLEIPLQSGRKALIRIPKAVTTSEITLIMKFIEAISPADVNV